MSFFAKRTETILEETPIKIQYMPTKEPNHPALSWKQASTTVKPDHLDNYVEVNPFARAEAITTQSQAVIREEIREDFTSLIREYIHSRPGVHNITLETVVESLVKAAISRSTKWRCSDKSL